jgi:TetR/AcrR family transcriptional regulator, transcriptional repressor for nem operon
MFDTHPSISQACQVGIAADAQTLIPTIKAVQERYAPDADWSAESLALYTQAALQGAFIIMGIEPY